VGRDDEEVPLSGGTLNQVVRVGDTVRRPAGPWTATIHDLLRHLRIHNFRLAPEPLGLDERGREILRFIPGQTVGWSLPWPAWIRSDDMLVQIGAATAAYHAAVAGFRPNGTVEWRSGPGRLAPQQIVCHHDLAPYNVVVRDGRLAGFIDWDLAGPGQPISDLAFVAWQWVPLHGPAVASFMGWDGADRAARLNLLLDAYGLGERGRFIDAVIDRVQLNRSIMLERAAAGDPAYQVLVQQGHVGGMDEALAFLHDQGPELQASI
jgi:Phosphotransferase enzyme family